MAITSAVPTSFHAELAMGGHDFSAVATATATTTSGNFTLTALSTIIGLNVGKAVSGTGIPANTVIASIDSASQITLSKAATASGTVTITASGDSFYLALFKASVSGSFGADTTNYSDMGAQEVVGAGYTAGGILLVPSGVSISGTTAMVSFANPTWTSATFSTDGALLYNASNRLGGLSGTNATGRNRAVMVFSFPTQTIGGGNFSLVMPPVIATSALVRIS